MTAPAASVSSAETANLREKPVIPVSPNMPIRWPERTPKT